MKYPYFALGAALLVALSTGCSDERLRDPFPARSYVVASGLAAPIGMAADEKGQIWVSEAGTGQSDGRVSVVTKDGMVYPVFTGFSSVFANGAIEGMGHVLYRNGVLYILDGGAGRLYRAEVAGLKPGDPAQPASNLPSEDIGTYVRSLNLVTPNISNLYNLTFGPDGHLYIVDASANIVLRRNSRTREVSVFARIPDLAPRVQAVPTGIVFDGSRFLVSTLSGFPFARGVAKIFQVSMAGAVSEYRSGFTSLTDLTLTDENKPLVTEYGSFVFNPPTTVGFQPSTGRVATEAAATVQASLDRPTDIEHISRRFYYVLSYGDGTLRALRYQGN